jgi:uncharacterized protein (DUF433 family)
MYGGVDPREVPAYATWEAARYLRMPLRTLQNWTFGYRVGNRVAAPLVQIADSDRHRLSFWNVAELHVLDSLRRFHGITPQKLRRLITHLEDKFDTSHPLVNERMLTNGVSVFVDKAGLLINATSDGQLALRNVVEAHLQRIEVDVDGLAMILYPFVRQKPDPKSQVRMPEEPKLIAMDPRVRFGRPVIVNTSIPTAEIASRFRAGDSFEDLAAEYGREKQEIEEAIRCELTLDPAA